MEHARTAPEEAKPIEPEVMKIFEAAVKEVLEDEQTKKNLEKLARSHDEVSVENVRAELLASADEVIDRAATMLKGWKGAKKRLRKAKAARRKMVLDALRSWILWVTLGLVVAIVFLVALTLPGNERRAFLIVTVGSGIVGGALGIGLSAVFDPTVRVRRRARREARDRFVKVLRAQTAVAVREFVNLKLTSFSTAFDVRDGPGLRQMADPEREVPTSAVDELTALITSLDSGSIGISGPRGCGKTTMIRTFTDGTTMPFPKELVGLTVAAPVKYDAREFVLHLFASLCERVLRNRPEDLARSGSRWAQARKKRLFRLIGVLGLAMTLTGLALLLEPAPSKDLLGWILLAVGSAGGYAWLLALLSALGSEREEPKKKKFDPDRENRARRSAERAAKDYLAQIRFQQTYASSRSGGLKLPLGFSLGADSSTSFARTPWTLPEAVEEFRRFVAILAERYVVIGIDELDKMDSDQSAREFLNNVKGVFGVPGCYFLVSVSEDAMSAFERRGLPIRDVFDSSFDKIQRVGYLNLDESLRVLGGRVVGLPIPFQCLCHCLAGGLPRDLIRVTRELADKGKRLEAAKKKKILEAGTTPPERVEIGLDELTTALIETEWQGKLDGATAAWRASERTQPWWLSKWLQGQIEGELSAVGLLESTLKLGSVPGALDPDGTVDEDARKARRIAVEMVAFSYYAATVLDAFDRDAGGQLLEDPDNPGGLNPKKAATIETLARARQQFAVDPWLAWDLIDRGRAEIEMDPWPHLRPVASNGLGPMPLLNKMGAALGLGS